MARLEEREQSRPETAGRAGAGDVSNRSADERLDHIRVARERGIELTHDLRCGSLLRSVDRGSALRSKQRIANVARNLDRRTDQARIGLAIDTTEPRERRAALGEVIAASIEKAVAEGARHAGAAVGRRAPTDADEDRKSTRLNSSHITISYAVFCLKKKNEHVPDNQLHYSLS